MRHLDFGKEPLRRRGATMVFVVVTMPVLLGMAALTIDTARLFNTRAALQNTADAAVLAAAQDLGGADPIASINAAKAEAAKIIALNPIWHNQGATGYQIVFGQSQQSADGTQVNFVPGATPPNAVQVTVNYNLDFTFGQALGLTSRQVSASAVSSIRSRDVMFVLDSSCTMGGASNFGELAADLNALGEPFVDSDSGKDTNGNGDSDDSDVGDDVKVTLCHIPKGKINKAKTIKVDQAKVNKHLNHGDTPGACAGGLTGCNLGDND